MSKFKSILKKFTLCLAIPLALVLVSCSTKDIQYYFDKLGGGSNSTVEINSVDTSDIQTNLKNSISSYSNLTDEQNTVVCSSYSDTNTNITEITSAGSYYYNSSMSGSITIKKSSGQVHLYFDNVNLSSDGAKVIDAKSSEDLVITLIGQNTISNSSDTSANAISTSGNLTINGTGTLDITSSKSGIKCDKVFYGLGGSVNITAQNHGISADSIYLNGITININSCGKDGLHAESDYDDLESGVEIPTFSYEKGFVYITGQTILNISNCYGDGIQGDSFVYINGGTITISANENTDSYFETYTATSDREKGCYTKSGNTYTKVSSDEVKKGTTYYKLSESVKAIKVGEIDYSYTNGTEGDVVSSNYTILIEGGTLTLSTIDDSIHSNSGSVLIYGGEINISTSDDGIHADTNLIVGGGSINVSKSYEGLEGQTIEISDGNVKIIASDDGINAADSDLSTNAQKTTCQILISGGLTYVSSGGDGVDSNGGILVTGGELYVYGPTSSADAALDSENGIIINGGIVIAVGPSGMVETPSTSSTQCVISMNLNSSTSGNVVVKDSSENTLISFSPSSIFATIKSYSSVVISCNSFVKGSKYTIVTGNTKTLITTNSTSTIITNGNPKGGPKQ